MNDERWTCEQLHQTKLWTTKKKLNRLKPVQHDVFANSTQRKTSDSLFQNYYPPTAMSKIIPAFIFRLDFLFRSQISSVRTLRKTTKKQRWRCIADKCIRNAFRAQLIFIQISNLSRIFIFTFWMHPWWHCSMRIDDGDSSEYNPLRAWHNPFDAISTRPIVK